MKAESFTNSSLSCARLCLQKYELQYNQRLERAFGDEREVLQVGQVWHQAFDVQARGGNPYDAIAARAPGARWVVKLSRLFAAYAWYWSAQPVALMETEAVFSFELNGRKYEGQRDGRLKTPDGRRGLIERKTTSDAIDAPSDYWRKLALDVQVGLYGVAENRPDFILYDVVRKPTINPKTLTKAELVRMRKGVERDGSAVYFEERFSGEHLAEALATESETLELYGARLTADIGNRPTYYFARREVPRTGPEYDALLVDLDRQVRVIEHAEREGLWFRNPDACDAFGTCAFFSLCSNNAVPLRGAPPPEGFKRRQHVHPELVRDATLTKETT